MPIVTAIFERIYSFDFCRSHMNRITKELLHQNGYVPFCRVDGKTIWTSDRDISFVSTSRNHVLGLTRVPARDPWIRWQIFCDIDGWYMRSHDRYDSYTNNQTVAMSPHQIQCIIDQIKREIK